MRRLRAILERGEGRGAGASTVGAADRLPRRMSSPLRKLPLAALARARGPRARRVRGLPHARDDGHLRRRVGRQRPLPERRPADLPGPALARAEPLRRRRLRLPAGPHAGAAQAESPARSGSRSSCRSTTTPRARTWPPTTSTISDTQDNVYTPDGARPDQRVRLPRRADRRPTAGCRSSDSVAANGPTQGALLLYKIQIVSLDNRPLELKIVDPLEPRPDGLGRARRLSAARAG